MTALFFADLPGFKRESPVFWTGLSTLESLGFIF